MSGRPFIVYDTETTGLRKAEADLTLPAGLRQRGDEVCQIGGITLDANMEPVRLFCHYCDTVAASSDPKAYAVHQIDLEEVRKYVRCQYLSKVLTERLPEFFHQDAVFIGYNVEFDMSMVQQTISNSDLEFTWSPLRAATIPRSGRHSVDVSEFFKKTSTKTNGYSAYHRKLSSFTQELEPAREDFLVRYGHMEVETNCMELLGPSWERAHNAFFDALNTYLLWRDRIWRKKLV